MKKKIVVTGATGNIGSEIVRQLSAKGENVRAAVRNPSKAREMDLGSAMLVHWDYKKRDTFDSALENADRLVLIAPSMSPYAERDVNPAINAAKKAGIKHIIFISVMGAEKNDEIPVRKVEKHLIASGIDYTILRPNWLMQNFSASMAESVKQGGIFLPVGEAKTSFIDTRDIASVAVQAFADNIHKNKEYTLTGGEAIDYNQVAKHLSDATGKPVMYQDIPATQFREAMKGFGYDEPSLDFIDTLFSVVKDGYTSAMTQEVQNILGRPPITFDTFAKDHAEVWK